MTSPLAGTTNVPTNTLLWGHGSTGTTRLMGPRGEVALEDYSFPASGPEGMIMPWSVLRPAAELEPDTRYTLVTERDSEDEYPPERTAFMTGNGPAAVPPPLPQLLSVIRGAGPTFAGPSPGRWLELEFAHHGAILLGAVEGALGNVPPEDALLDDDPSLDESRDVAGAPVVVWITGTHLSAGTGDCMIWPGPSNRHSARFGVMDVAGNFSGWSNETVLELPDDAEAQQLADEAAAQERARQEALVELQQSKPRMGLFEGHNTGCALSVANPRALFTQDRGSILAALIALAAALVRSRKRLPSHPTRSIDH